MHWFEAMGDASGWHLSSWASKLEVHDEGITLNPECTTAWLIEKNSEIAMVVNRFEKEGLACA